MSNCDADTFLIKPMDKSEFARKKAERDAQKRAYWRHALLPASVQEALIQAVGPGVDQTDLTRVMRIDAVTAQARLQHPQCFK